MAELINWLHFSDLHFGKDHSCLWPKLKNELFSDLRKVGQKVGPIDIVFFTGDFVQSGQKAEFDDLSRELVELWEVLAKIGNKPVLCAVPGNHDLCRPLSADLIPTTLKHWWNDQEMRQQFWKTHDSQLHHGVNAIFKNYTDWLATLQIPQLQTKKGILPGDFSATFEKGARRIGVVGLNTSFLQITPGDFESKLDTHVEQLLAICEGDADRWVRERDISLLLTHQPMNWLHPKSQQDFRDEIYPSDRFHALLCGHQHIPSQQDFSEGGSTPRRVRQGPSLFGLEKYGGSLECIRQHGYNAGQFQFDGNHGIERVWPRDAVKALSGGIRLRPDQHYDLTEDDCVVSAFDIDREGIDEEGACIRSGSNISETIPAVLSESTGEPKLALLDSVPDEATAIINLATCARFALTAVPHHCAVRLDEQSQFENALRQKRLVWVTADWATGVEGFLAASLDRFRKQITETAVFQLRCEEGNDPDLFESLFPQQFGMSMQRFCALLAPLPAPFLLLTGISSVLSSGEAFLDFNRIISAILDYCPNLRIIITARNAPQNAMISRVELRPLDAPDVRAYLLNHSESNVDIRDSDTIEKIHERSDGLPGHIDRMLRALKVSSLESVLEAELEGVHSGELVPGDVPKSLVQLIESLVVSKDRNNQRSLLLLKVLSVLPFGETIEGMRHYLPTEPFFLPNAVYLNELGLLDVIPLGVTTPRIAAGPLASNEHVAPKLLKVPRQVRDYVQSLLSDLEWKDFIYAGADQFFGRRWKEGRIKPRLVSSEYREFLENRPGNEFAVVHYLLQDAKTKGDCAAARRAARLAIHYCRVLRNKDRFRDLVIVAGGILNATDPSAISEQWAEIAYLYGLALRMTGKRTAAVAYLRNTLTISGVQFDDEIRASIYLNIALGEESDGHSSSAIAAAEEVKRLSGEDDAKYFQAQCIIEGLQNSGPTRIQKLRILHQEARAKRFITSANNLALEIAGETNDQSEKTKLLNIVLANDSADTYNKTRAIAAKTKVKSNSLDGTSFDLRDRLALSEAYSYAHSQRFGSLFDTCHDGMWRSLQEDGNVQQLLRLFRHSSFIWRIRGEDKREVEYANKLSSLKPPEETALPARLLVMEVSYFWKRFKAITKNALL